MVADMLFVLNDPPEFLRYDSMKEVLAYHEAGHLLLAYFYGYQIGMFRFWDNMPDVFGSVRNRRMENPPVKDSLENLTHESRKLLAGDVAARIHMKLPLTDYCLPLTSPEISTVSNDTPFASLKYVVSQGPNHDGIKLLERYRENQETIPGTWWTWFWEQHSETVRFLQQHWQVLAALGEKLRTVEPDEFDSQKMMMQGYRPGKRLIEWCEEVEAPRLNPELKSVPY